MAEGVWTIAVRSKCRHEMNVSRARSPVKAADTIRDPRCSKAEDRAAVSSATNQGPCWRPSDLPWWSRRWPDYYTVRDRFRVRQPWVCCKIADYFAALNAAAVGSISSADCPVLRAAPSAALHTTSDNASPAAAQRPRQHYRDNPGMDLRQPAATCVTCCFLILMDDDVMVASVRALGNPARSRLSAGQRIGGAFRWLVVACLS